MDSFRMYFGGSRSLYNYEEEAEEDSGVEDVPFSFFTHDLYASSDTSTQNSVINHADDEDLTYIDDENDHDYRPNKSAYSKKHGKRPFKRRQFNGNTCLSQLMTPEKHQQQHQPQHHHQHHDYLGDIDMSHMRHYARKDRTPNTIMKMMEKHRESERVRHHTLNESMKDVCLRVPGYDSDVKETKVIQMQRIIAYECFLENTLNNICELIDVNPKQLRIGTNFITDAMKNTPMEEFYQPSHYRTSDVEEDGENILTHRIKQEKPDMSNLAFELPRRYSSEKKSQKYRQKISSPTIDSTTVDLVKLLPLSTVTQVPAYQFVTSSCLPAKCFVPIDHTSSAQCVDSSQESGIKMEATQSQSTIYDEDSHFQDDISTFMDTEQLKAVTPSFMRDEANTSITSNTDTDQVFDLSSPDRHHHGKVFLQSPKSTSVWSKQGRVCFPDKNDTPKGKEMQTVSPENILETKPKLDVECDQSTASTSTNVYKPLQCSVSNVFQSSPDTHIMSTATSNTKINEMQYVFAPPGTQFNAYRVVSESSKDNGCIIYIPKFENGVFKLNCDDIQESEGRNKRKRYTPVKTADKGSDPLNVETVVDDDDDADDDDEDFDDISRILDEFMDTYVGDLGRNKRKRYTPVKTADKGSDPLNVETVVDEAVVDDDDDDDDDEDFDDISRILDEFMDTYVGDLDSEMQQSQPEPKLGSPKLPTLPLPLGQQLPIGFPPTWGYPAPAPCRGQGKKVKYAKPLVDHRKSTWMNGFMMFSKLNRSKFTGENPGVHTSQIQKMMGEAWRKLTNEEKQPYRDQAKEWCERMKTAGDNANQTQTDQVNKDVKTVQSNMDKKDISSVDSDKPDSLETVTKQVLDIMNGLGQKDEAQK